MDFCSINVLPDDIRGGGMVVMMGDDKPAGFAQKCQ